MDESRVRDFSRDFPVIRWHQRENRSSSITLRSVSGASVASPSVGADTRMRDSKTTRDPDPGSGPQEPIPMNDETAFYDTDYRDWIEEAIGQIDEITTPSL